MAKGISTDQKIGDEASCLRQESLDFVIRYYSASAWKRMELPEAKALAAAGLRLVAVYEDGPTDKEYSGYFSAQRGTRAATAAFQFAADVISQPYGTAIYFAIDHDYQYKPDLDGSSPILNPSETSSRCKATTTKLKAIRLEFMVLDLYVI